MTTPTPPATDPSPLAKYRKAVLTVVVTVLTFVATVLTGGINAHEWVLIAGVTVASLNVALVPELETGIGSVAKTASTFLLAGLTVLATAALGHMGTADWIEVIVASLAAIGVTGVPNAWPPAIQPLAVQPSVRQVPPVS